MKQIYVLITLLLFTLNLSSQITLSSGHTYDAFLSNCGYAFNVQNNNSYSIRLFRINARHATDFKPKTLTMNVWYKTTVSNAAPGVITAGNGWINAGSFVHNQSFTSILPMLSNLAIDIPANTTYRIVVTTTDSAGLMKLTAGTGVNTYTNSGVTLITGDSVSYYGTPPTTISTLTTPYGFVGDIEFYPLVACSGTPEVGNIVGINSSCPNENKFYYLENYISGSNITYQWQVANSPAGTYTNIGTNTTILARTMGAVNQYYRCIATCTNSSLKDTTPIFADTIKPFYFCYCTSKASTTDDTKIDSVVFNDVRVGTSPTLCTDYTDYRTSIAPTILRASYTYPVEVVNGSCSGLFYSSRGGVFVDFNKSGVFDATERLGTGWTATSLGQRFASNLSIPLNPTATGITGLRVMHYETITAPPTTTCGNPVSNWGETNDFLVKIVKDTFDARMMFIDSFESGCTLSNANVRFNVYNIGYSAINPLPMCYSINGGTPVCENFSSLAAGTTSFYTFSTQVNLTGPGSKILKIWHNNPLDTNKSNDTLVKTIVNFPTPPTPVPDDDTVCFGAPQTILRCPSYDSFMTRWYTDATGLNEIAQGNQLIINNPTANITRYAKSVYIFSENVGALIPTNPEIGVGGSGQGLIFDVLRNKVKINSVKMKFTTSGIGSLELRTSANVLLTSVSFIVTTPNSVMTIPVNFELPIGTGYRMLLGTNPGLTIASSNYSSFPQRIPNVISITGSTTANQYNFFYDWNVTYDACTSPLVTVNSKYISTTNSPARTLYKDTFFCQYPDVYLNANNAGCTYKWQDNSTAQTIKVTTSGYYIVTITNSLGCNVVDSSKIAVRISPIFSLGKDTTVCSGKNALLKSGFSNQGYNHVWNDGSLNPFLTVSNAGTYYVNVFNTNTNCGYSDTINVAYEPSPNAFLGRDTFACNNAPITINAPYNTNYLYLWDNSSTPGTNNTKVVSTNGINKSWVQVMDISSPYGCKTSDTILTNIATLTKPNLGTDKVSCNSAESLGLTPDPKLGYSWNTGEVTSTITKSQAGMYILTVTEVNTTCSYSDTINLSFIASPPLNLGPDIFTCNSASVALNANSGWTSYAWSNGFTTNSINVSTSGTYIVTGTNSCGSKKDTVVVTFQTPVSPFVLPPDTLICAPITLSIPSQPSGNNILWSTAATTNSILVNQSGVYWVSVENACNMISDAIKVTLDTIPTCLFDVYSSGRFVSLLNKSLNAVSYRWEFGDDSVSTLKNPSHLYAVKGEYNVKLTVKNSCGDSVSTTQKIVLYNSGIDDMAKDDIRIYPNPTSDKFIIQNTNSVNGNYTIDILSIDGRTVKSMNARFNAKSEIEVGVEDVAAGSYLLRLIDNQNSQILRKVTIAR